MIALGIFFSFIAGVGIGVYATWFYMEWQWKQNPYRLKTIVDGVIALREAKKQAK